MTVPTGPGVGPLTFTLEASAAEVRRVLGRALVCFGPALDEEGAGSVQMALAEVMNNIVEHAYQDRQSGPIRLTLRRGEEGLTCQIEDEGLPMPGLALPPGRMQPVAAQTRDLAEGGWGWALIHALTEELSYDRVGGTNRLRFRVPLDGAPAGVRAGDALPPAADVTDEEPGLRRRTGRRSPKWSSRS